MLADAIDSPREVSNLKTISENRAPFVHHAESQRKIWLIS